MTVKVGDKVPEGTLMEMTDSGQAPVTTANLFGGKRVALFSVPGAFTPTCSNQHLPGFVANAAAIKAKGIDTIACIAVNDAFVMGAWGRAQNVGDSVRMLADGNATWTQALGLELDATGFGMGVRGKRFSVIVDDGTVTNINVDESGGLDVSSAETLLAQA
jgi:peroxiredoxin